MRNLDDLETEADRVRLHDLAHLRVERLDKHDLRAAGRVARDETRVGSDGGAVIAGCVGHVHRGQLADRRLVLEDRLEHPLAHLRLVRRVGGQELPAREHRIDDRGHVMVVDPRAEERELLRGVDILRRELLEMPHELGLGERRLEIEPALEADGSRNVAEEFLDGRDADRGQHLLAIGVCE